MFFFLFFLGIIEPLELILVSISGVRAQRTVKQENRHRISEHAQNKVFLLAVN